MPRANKGHYRIVCIAQVFNEMRKGNLRRFIGHISPLVDELVIYDDGSTDGTYEHLLGTQAHVIRGARNDFSSELRHKQTLVNAALEFDADFILWLDADEVLATETAEDLQRLCAWSEARSLDGVALQEINLWRSGSWKRLDSSFDAGWFVRLWRAMPDMSYDTTTDGLHLPQYPSSVENIERYSELKVLHYGFADERNLAYKYLVYRSHGQRGYEMLDRLVSEERLALEEVPAEEFPADLRSRHRKPEPMDFVQSLAYVERHRSEVTRPGFSIVCLVFKSVEWARFLYEQVLRFTDMSDKEFFFVANDASDEVLKYLRENYIPHVEWSNTEAHRDEWYINNVYRAYNFGATQARGDFVVFLNTDMGFSPGWFEALWGGYDGASALASRLVESGKLKTGLYGIEKDFGITPDGYREHEFVQFAEAIREPGVLDGGLYMPLLIRREHFLEVGGYPEGNMHPGSDIFAPDLALPGEASISGDKVLIQRLQSRGITHRTALDSIVYHFQMGEKDDESDVCREARSLVAVCNDLVTGTMGERVLWDFLLEGLPSSVGVDSRTVGTGGRYSTLARDYIRRTHPQTEVIIQNATFIDIVDPDRYTIAFLQDDLRAMGRDSTQQERNLSASRVAVTNSLLTAISYPEYDFEIIPVGVDETLFRPLDKKQCREENGLGGETIGVFVGAFDEVKGWPEVRRCIDVYPEITWLLITKREESFEAANAKTYCRVSQERLVTLLNAADFFIVGSPVETQCLAAIEACLCDVPVVMRNTGIFNELTDSERSQAGVFGEDLVAGVARVQEGSFRPRDLVLGRGWTVGASILKWRSLLERAFQDVSSERVGFVGSRVVDEDGVVSHRQRATKRSPYVPGPPQPSLPARVRSWAAEDLAPVLKEAGLLKPALGAWRVVKWIFRLK